MINLGKKRSLEFKENLRLKRLAAQRSCAAKLTNLTRLKISLNNAIKKPVLVLEQGHIVFRFKSIADCAKHFYGTQAKRYSIRRTIITGNLFINKYIIVIENLYIKNYSLEVNPQSNLSLNNSTKLKNGAILVLENNNVINVFNTIIDCAEYFFKDRAKHTKII